jgi:hypothetical protein
MYWACAQLEPFRERLALHCLGLNGFEIYCPRLREQIRSRGRKIVRTPLLFPNYTFVWIILRPHERVLVLLNLLGGQQRVELARSAIEVV